MRSFAIFHSTICEGGKRSGETKRRRNMDNPVKYKGKCKGKQKARPSMNDLLTLDQNVSPNNSNTLSNIALLNRLNNSTPNDLPKRFGQEGGNASIFSSQYCTKEAQAPNKKECELNRLEEAKSASNDLPRRLGSEDDASFVNVENRMDRPLRLNLSQNAITPMRQSLPHYLKDDVDNLGKYQHEMNAPSKKQDQDLSDIIEVPVSAEVPVSTKFKPIKFKPVVPRLKPVVSQLKPQEELGPVVSQLKPQEELGPVVSQLKPQEEFKPFIQYKPIDVEFCSNLPVSDDTSASDEDTTDNIPYSDRDYQLDGRILFMYCENDKNTGIIDLLQPIFPLDAQWLPFYLSNIDMSESTCSYGYTFQLHSIPEQLKKLDKLFKLDDQNRKMFYINIFYLKRLYSSRETSTGMLPLVQSWNTFVNHFVDNPVEFLTLFLRSRFKFESAMFSSSLRISTGLRMRIHRLSIMESAPEYSRMKSMPCMVPREMKCELCNFNDIFIVDTKDYNVLRDVSVKFRGLIELIRARDIDHARIKQLKSKMVVKQQRRSAKRQKTQKEKSNLPSKYKYSTIHNPTFARQVRQQQEMEKQQQMKQLDQQLQQERQQEMEQQQMQELKHRQKQEQMLLQMRSLPPIHPNIPQQAQQQQKDQQQQASCLPSMQQQLSYLSSVKCNQDSSRFMSVDVFNRLLFEQSQLWANMSSVLKSKYAQLDIQHSQLKTQHSKLDTQHSELKAEYALLKQMFEGGVKRYHE